MQLHNVRKFKNKRQRIGRGGKRGTTSGRGQKGQKSRAGRKLRPAERDLIIRIPKHRGFANKPKSEKPFIVNLKDISLAIKSLDAGKGPVVLNMDFLKKIGILKQDFKGDVKVLGSGEVESSITIKGIKVSKGAGDKIKKAGGTA